MNMSEKILLIFFPGLEPLWIPKKNHTKTGCSKIISPNMLSTTDNKTLQRIYNGTYFKGIIENGEQGNCQMTP